LDLQPHIFVSDDIDPMAVGNYFHYISGSGRARHEVGTWTGNDALAVVSAEVEVRAEYEHEEDQERQRDHGTGVETAARVHSDSKEKGYDGGQDQADEVAVFAVKRHHVAVC